MPSWTLEPCPDLSVSSKPVSVPEADIKRNAEVRFNPWRLLTPFPMMARERIRFDSARENPFHHRNVQQLPFLLFPSISFSRAHLCTPRRNNGPPEAQRGPYILCKHMDVWKYEELGKCRKRVNQFNSRSLNVSRFWLFFFPAEIMTRTKFLAYGNICVL